MTRRVDILKRKWPRDGVLRLKKAKQAVVLDGSLADNGGAWCTIDVSRGVQVGYKLGAVLTPVPTTDPQPPVDGKTPATNGVEADGQRVAEEMEEVETREWVGIDGKKTWENEHDLSYRQSATANKEDMHALYTKVGIFALAVIGGLIVCLIVVAGKLH